MAGVVQGERHPRQDLVGGAIVQGHEALHGAFGVAPRVERQDGSEALALALAVLPLAFLLGDEGRVAQHHRAQVTGRRLRVDRAAVAGFHQQRQTPGVIDVRVAKHHRVDGGHVEGQRFGVARLVPSTALDEAAVEQHAAPVEVQQVAGAGDLAGGAEMLDRRRAVTRAAHGVSL